MIFTSLDINNFLSIAEARLTFESGLHLISGVNHDMSPDGSESNGSVLRPGFHSSMVTSEGSGNDLEEFGRGSSLQKSKAASCLDRTPLVGRR